MNEVEFNDFVEVNNEKILYIVKRKKIKNINLRVTQNKEIIISMPMRMRIDEARRFVKSKYSWIKKQLQNVELYEDKKEILNFQNGDKVYLLGNIYNLQIEGSESNDVQISGNSILIFVKSSKLENKEYIKKVYENSLKSYCLLHTKQIIKEYDYVLQKYNIKFPVIEVKKMKTRWGVCYPFKNKIVFNLNLIKTPEECIEYVVLHELAHFKYQNHSKQFYSFVEQFIPDWQARRNKLNKEFSYIV